MTHLLSIICLKADFMTAAVSLNSWVASKTGPLAPPKNPAPPGLQLWAAYQIGDVDIDGDPKKSHFDQIQHWSKRVRAAAAAKTLRFAQTLHVARIAHFAHSTRCITLRCKVRRTSCLVCIIVHWKAKQRIQIISWQFHDLFLHLHSICFYCFCSFWPVLVFFFQDRWIFCRMMQSLRCRKRFYTRHVNMLQRC